MDPLVVSFDELFVLALSEWQTYGLFFLLGSFAVATLSDVRRMSAQREFLEVWVFFVLAMFALDLYHNDWSLKGLFAVKWGTIIVLSLLSWQRVGPIFRLARADVAACAALAALLSPGFIVLFWALLKVASWIEAPMLAKKGGVYPFLPVVSTATIAVLLIAKFADRVVTLF
ncbi:MAG: hypothetical protein ACT4PT_13000 [Methanobacteriota archaeon]